MSSMKSVIGKAEARRAKVKVALDKAQRRASELSLVATRLSRALEGLRKLGDRAGAASVERQLKKAQKESHAADDRAQALKWSHMEMLRKAGIAMDPLGMAL